MKKVLSFMAITAAIAVVMTACNGISNTQPASNTDTAGLAEFKTWQAWKLQQETMVPVANQPVAVKRTSSKSGSMSTSSTNEAKTVKKKGMSKAAKGAVIGGVTGAVAGAIINKRNRVAGGVIGGILGGGVGYGIGRSKDKKDGRY